MNITIKIIYKGYEVKTLSQGSFEVRNNQFKRDPQGEAALMAYKWIKQIRRESHLSEIIKVAYNEENDITGIVKQMDNAPIPDLDLPF